jgi:glutaredoxin
MSEKQVKMLVLTTCMQCRALIDMLKSHGVEVDATNVDLMEKEEREALFTKMAPFNEKKAFPVTFIGNKAIIGFQKKVIMDELGIAP